MFRPTALNFAPHLFEIFLGKAHFGGLIQKGLSVSDGKICAINSSCANNVASH